MKQNSEYLEKFKKDHSLRRGIVSAYEELFDTFCCFCFFVLNTLIFFTVNVSCISTEEQRQHKMFFPRISRARVCAVNRVVSTFATRKHTKESKHTLCVGRHCTANDQHTKIGVCAKNYARKSSESTFEFL